LPSIFRVVDARNQRPLSGVWVFALWKSYAVTLAGANPGPRLMARAARSSATGWVFLPAAFTVHRPMAPLSIYARDWNHFPQLLMIARGYAPKLEKRAFFSSPTVLLGSPPIAAPMHLGTRVELTAAAPMSRGDTATSAGRIRDALASASALLSQRERCELVRPANATLDEVLGALAPAPIERRDAFERELAACP